MPNRKKTAKAPKIFCIGVSGGIGSGKSTVCKFFSDAGIPVIEADIIARDIMNSESSVKSALIKLLGDEIYDSKGILNRSVVASKIFSVPTLRKKVNAIVHPKVEKEILKQISALENEGIPIVIVEAALIYEAGLDKKLDIVVVVQSQDEKRIERLVKRDGVKHADIKARINAQLPQEKIASKADYLIINDGSKDDLRIKTQFLYSIFKLQAS